MTTEIDAATANDLLAKLDDLENEARRAGLLDAEMRSSVCILRASLRRSARGARPLDKKYPPNYTYVECARCNRKGTPRCRRKGKRWSFSVIPGCMEHVADAPRFIKVDSTGE